MTLIMRINIYSEVFKGCTRLDGCRQNFKNVSYAYNSVDRNITYNLYDRRSNYITFTYHRSQKIKIIVIRLLDQKLKFQKM
jgi:hypothetical protein